MIKIGIIGTGSIGLDHIKAIDVCDNCCISAVCDINETVAKELAEKYNVPYFTDYHDMPGNVEMDAVILNLPHFLHCESTVFFLEKGYHVLVEKPMANTVEECDRMIEASKKSGKKLAVGHIQRFFGSNSHVKKIIESGRLGKLCMFSENRTIDYFLPTRPRWFLEKEKSGGGIVMNYGAHALDKLFYQLGCQDVEVVSSTGNVKNDESIEGHAQFLLKFKDGFSAVVTFSGYSNTDYDARYYFTNGALKVVGTFQLFEFKDGNWQHIDTVENTTNAMKLQIEEFIKFINDEPCNIADGEYGKAVIKVIEKIYG